MGRKRRRRSRKPKRIRLDHVQPDPNVPTYDYLERMELEDPSYIDQALDNLIDDIKSGDFLRWEAVIRREQSMRLTKAHKEALSELLWFGDEGEGEADQPIWYIDELPRPSKLWYEIAQEIVSHMVEEPFETEAGGWWSMYEGWPALVKALEEHGQSLSLPEGAKSPLDIFPVDLRHRLWLQMCFDALSGLGQEEELTLENEEQRSYRMDWFIRCLRKHRDSVRHLDLTLDDLLTKIIMPPQDERVFVKEMMERLKLTSAQEHLAGFL